MRTKEIMPNRKSIPLAVLGVLLVLATVLPNSTPFAACSVNPEGVGSSPIGAARYIKGLQSNLQRLDISVKPFPTWLTPA